MSNMIDVVVLAAGSIKQKLYLARYGFDCPALLPINVTAISCYIFDFYLQTKNVRIHLAVDEKHLDAVKKEFCYYEDKVSYISVPPAEGVIETLKTVVRKLSMQKEVKDIIVNLVTTIPVEFPEKNEVFISEKLQKNNNWSSVILRTDSVDFCFKNTPCEERGYAFTGVFRTNKTDLCKAMEDKKLFANDLLSVIRGLGSNTNILFKKTHWLDCGHESNYYETKMDLVTSRSFNHIRIDRTAGIITKSSKNTDKFKNEINYVHMLPKELAVFYPRILSEVRTNNDFTHVDMEYYGYPTVSEYMLFWQLNDDGWQRLFEALEFILNLQKKHKYSISHKAFQGFYYNKCLTRISDFEKQLPEKYQQLLKAQRLNINGQEYQNFRVLESRISEKLDRLYNEDDFCIMHGDFCFNNMLYDLNSGVMRLIDARGSFGEQCIGIYGDFKYDIAKLAHSVIGYYDYIVNYKFYLRQLSDTKFVYSINLRPWQDFLCQQTNSLIKQQGYNPDDILFLAGLIFVSICPLHSDNTEKQVMIYLKGIQLLNDFVGS
ncbi:MAG: hypothetical protein UT30_C0014G0008 [Candidatus Uhrbacteria bacterium GW2011_GWF2_39_13]|uniref:Capsular polysaccharide biosynthesis protein n=1 Tax=Candidatus Uhrbacteria bacterium GW2011_GWF2_39_13 TaxID=1618995 RepID=A0A0G0Q0R9_9BACT|nr:MAG: hypothetical protein UT30_C0014G0008 [Candidatus Uhrbacteria bacterium GW2011_GWF2_39_13]